RQRAQGRPPGWGIVALQPTGRGPPPKPSGGLDLVRPAGTGGDPDLVGREHAGRPIELAETVTNHLLGRAIHGRGIDQASAGIEEGPHHLRAGVARNRVVADIEGDPAAKPDRGQLFAGRGYRLAEQASLLRRRELWVEQRGSSGCGQAAKQPAATEW